MPMHKIHASLQDKKLAGREFATSTNDRLRRLGRAMPLCAAALLAGCAGVAGLMGAIENVYDGPERPDSQVALIAGEWTSNHPVAQFSAVDDTTWGNGPQGWPRQVKVLPGVHLIRPRCVFDSGIGYGQVFAVKVEAGHRYEMRCNFIPGGVSAEVVPLP